MLKKVLSVVLALVLALSVVAIAASAATASDLEDYLIKLPNPYDAHFYNDETEALILEKRAMVEAALESGDAATIDQACADCEAALAEIYKEWIIPDPTGWSDGQILHANRDESKAIADWYFSYEEENDDGYLMPGETVTVKLSLQTNFYVWGLDAGFVYDDNIFELAGYEWCDDVKDTLDTLYEANPDYGYIDGEYIFPDCYPEKYQYDEEFQAKWGLMSLLTAINATTMQFFNPTEEIKDVYTITLKVKDDAEIGSEARIWVDQDFVATWDNYLLGYETPLFRFDRANALNCHDTIYDLQYKDFRNAEWATDEMCCSGQTINFHNNDKTFIIGEAPEEELDYTALEAAIASKSEYEAFNYTDESWAAFEDAIAAGEEDGMVADTQKGIDSYTDAIVAAREALVPFVNESEIISVTEMSTPTVGEYLQLDVLVSKPVMKLQFVNSAGNTITFSKDYAHTLSVEETADGEVWHIEVMVYDLSENYNIHVRNLDTGWSDKYYRYVLSDNHKYDGTIISYEIPDAYKNKTVQVGHHDVIVKTGLDIFKIQIDCAGSTATYAKTSAAVKSVEEAEDCLIWTIDYNFVKTGNGIVYDFNSRTYVSSFEKSDVNMVLNVVY